MRPLLADLYLGGQMYINPGLARYEIRSLRLLIDVLKRYRRRRQPYRFADGLPYVTARSRSDSYESEELSLTLLGLQADSSVKSWRALRATKRDSILVKGASSVVGSPDSPSGDIDDSDL